MSTYFHTAVGAAGALTHRVPVVHSIVRKTHYRMSQSQLYIDNMFLYVDLYYLLYLTRRNLDYCTLRRPSHRGYHVPVLILPDGLQETRGDRA